MYRFLLFATLAASVFGEIPNSVMAEQDLQKRSDLALQEADEEISAAAKAYSVAGANRSSKSILCRPENLRN